jgi:isoleucyl-tRNA synthetase
VRNLKADGHATVSLGGEDIAVTLDEVILTEVPHSGWAVISQQGMTVALDTTITPELRNAGLAREVIRLVQTARKEADLKVTDRIMLSWAANGETADALRKHKRQLADAVLAVEITEYALGDIPAEANASDTGMRGDDELGVRFWLTKAAHNT